MSIKRDKKPEGKKSRTPSEKEVGGSKNEKSRSNPSRPGYLKPKDKKGTSRFKSGDEGKFKRSTENKPYGRRPSSKDTGRAGSRTKFLQPKDDNFKSRGEKPFNERDSNRPERRSSTPYRSRNENQDFHSEKTGRTPYFKNRDDKPKGRGEEKRAPFRGNKDERPFNKERKGKPSYSDNKNEKSKYGRVEETGSSYRKDEGYNKGDNKREGFNKPPHSKSRQDKPDFSESGKKRRPSFEKYPGKGESHENSRSKSHPKRSVRKEDFPERKSRPLSLKAEEKNHLEKSTESQANSNSNKSGEIRLNRFVANSGVCSRRDADLLIQAGEISVNGKVITEMGYKVNLDDEVRYNNRRLKREKMVYVLLNKPKDFITTTDDPENRKTIMQLVEGVGSERIYPVGRLDRNTTGLILLTNDGELADKLSHPSNNIKKLYQVDLAKPISDEDMIKIQEGITLEDGVAEIDQLAIVSADKTSLGLQIHSGKNRIVRRIFEHLGYDVVKLDRVMYAGLDKKDLPRGKWRLLSEKELIHLKYMKKG